MKKECLLNPGQIAPLTKVSKVTNCLALSNAAGFRLDLRIWREICQMKKTKGCKEKKEHKETRQIEVQPWWLGGRALAS